MLRLQRTLNIPGGGACLQTIKTRTEGPPSLCVPSIKEFCLSARKGV